MSDDDVRELAVLVQVIAASCWPDLGTALSAEIIARAGQVIENLDSGDRS